MIKYHKWNEYIGRAETQKLLMLISENFISALPETGPRISGGKKTYYRGDVVRVNCTSARSKPAAKLHWFVNNNKVIEFDIVI